MFETVGHEGLALGEAVVGEIGMDGGPNGFVGSEVVVREAIDGFGSPRTAVACTADFDGVVIGDDGPTLVQGSRQSSGPDSIAASSDPLLCRKGQFIEFGSCLTPSWIPFVEYVDEAIVVCWLQQVRHLVDDDVLEEVFRLLH